VAGLLKVVLSLQHERVPAHLNFTAMNPDIDWGDVPVEIPVGGREWKRGARRRIAGVSSFGFSGTNAHIVLEEAPGDDASISEESDGPRLFTLSARTEAARDELALRFARIVGGHLPCGEHRARALR
jgi:acyl transferase domain-containing protein